MKERGVIVVLLLIVLIALPSVLATNHTNHTNSSNSSTPSSTLNKDTDKVTKAYQCIEKKADDCKGLATDVLALTILAGPANIYDSCVTILKGRKVADASFGGVKETALAILALDHAGEDTTDSQKWLESKAQAPTDLVWYLEQDSNGPVSCNLQYDGNDYTVNIGDDKKIDKNAGSCLQRSQSNFWLTVDSDCYGKDIKVKCDVEFIATLLYKDTNSPTIYVLEGTDGAEEFGEVDINVKSTCYGDNTCDYEATVWAAIALLKTGNDIEDAIPYIIAKSESNKRYLPNSFIYMVTAFDEYANTLITNQKLGNYWLADNSQYNRFYDTALALLSLGDSSADKIVNANNWLWFTQGNDGCWQGSLRDTAMVVWALEGTPGKLPTIGTPRTECTSANFFCTPRNECTGTDILNNFHCDGLSTICCKTQDLKSCSELSGEVCATNRECVGLSKTSTEGSCCLGLCKEPELISECEDQSYICRDECSSTQTQTTHSCDSSSQVCCRPQPAQRNSSDGVAWWIWLLLILILGAAIIILWIKRSQVKLIWFKMKSRFRKDKGGPPSSNQRRPPFPPGRPGYPPQRRPLPPQRRMPPRPAKPHPQQPQGRPTTTTEKEMSDTFSKLKEFSK